MKWPRENVAEPRRSPRDKIAIGLRRDSETGRDRKTALGEKSEIGAFPAAEFGPGGERVGESKDVVHMGNGLSVNWRRRRFWRCAINFVKSIRQPKGERRKREAANDVDEIMVPQIDRREPESDARDEVYAKSPRTVLPVEE